VKFYLDASFVVSLFISDAHTEKADRWIAGRRDTAIVSALCALEFAASVSRGVRTGRLSSDAAAEILFDFDEWRSHSAVSLIQSLADFALAESLVRDFPTKLVAPDALHLASAINASAKMVTFDGRLAETAQSRGAGVETFA
jgi:predicted nucleic acid-binding protein